jgi:hypothetical protein
MAKLVVIDEVILTVRVPATLLAAEADAARRVLMAPDFLDRLRKAVRGVVRASPELTAVRLGLTR